MNEINQLCQTVPKLAKVSEDNSARSLLTGKIFCHLHFLAGIRIRIPSDNICFHLPSFMSLMILLLHCYDSGNGAFSSADLNARIPTASSSTIRTWIVKAAHGRHGNGSARHQMKAACNCIINCFLGAHELFCSSREWLQPQHVV